MDMDLILFEGKTFMIFCFEAKNLKRKDAKDETELVSISFSSKQKKLKRNRHNL
jgi:hypothetical protein